MIQFFVNGEFIGSTYDFGKVRSYPVPVGVFKEGKNVITMRISAEDALGGILGKEDELYIQSGSKKISIAGEWLYKTASDINTLPEVITIPGLLLFGAPQSPMVIYNSMIAPLIPYTIKGVIWYQGESNADSFEEANQYYSLFPALINDWRNQWGYDFPFLFVQLAGYGTNKSEPADYPWAYVREAQSEALTLPNTGMAVAIDIGDEYDIHPKNKLDVAYRLFLAAEKVAYHENVVSSGPTFKSMAVEENRIRLTF